MEVVVSPLTIHQKASVEEAAQGGGSSNLLKAALRALKYSVKSVSGLELQDGSQYELQFDEDGTLKDSCIDDLLNIQQSTKLISVALNLVNSVPEKFYDLSTGKVLDGVSFIQDKDRAPKAKKSKVVSG
jgi:hypothetical protein